MNDIRRILTPTDFCRAGDAALELACWLAEHFRAELHVLHAAPPRGGFAWGRAEEEDRGQQARRRLDALPDPDRAAGLVIHRDVREGPPAKVISEYAKEHEIDLIVMPAAARRDKQQSLDARVLEKVSLAAPCPVMGVPELGSVITRSLVEDGARALQRNFGNELRGEHAETRASLVNELAAALHLEEQFAQGLCGELEQRHVLVWSEPTPSTNGEPTDEGTQGGSPAGSWRIYPAALHLEDEEEGDDVLFPDETELSGDKAPALNLLRRAIAARATDIHIDPCGGGEVRIRFRIDGHVEEFCRVHPHVGHPLVLQLMTMADINVTERFHPREGRLKLPGSFADWQVRITVAPVPGGDAVALRLLSRARLLRPMSDWGLSRESFSAVYRMLHQQAGLVLATGPAGAGKTTTVYSMLNVLLNEERNVISIEDPVELTVPFMRQLNVDDRHEVT
ncbi:MAG: Flp pilus assembly complex ATPase component TadA, partial [Planctomycetes bacterium]|nr:Flp pilus assembly complex ATPase component TadA [Planctomycetota bacterium]